MHDEQTDDERKKSEGREIEVKAVRQPGEIASLPPASIIAVHRRERLEAARPRAVLRTDEETRELSGPIEQALRDADVDDEHAGRHFLDRGERRQSLPALGRGRASARQARSLHRLRRDDRRPGRLQELLRDVRALSRAPTPPIPSAW